MPIAEGPGQDGPSDVVALVCVGVEELGVACDEEVEVGTSRAVASLLECLLDDFVDAVDERWGLDELPRCCALVLTAPPRQNIVDAVAHEVDKVNVVASSGESCEGRVAEPGALAVFPIEGRVRVELMGQYICSGRTRARRKVQCPFTLDTQLGSILLMEHQLRVRV